MPENENAPMEMLPIAEVGVKNKIASAIGEPLTDVTWPAGTTVRLCNVPWDSDYCNVVAFEDQAARTAYFEGLGTSVTLNNMTYAFPGLPVRIDLPYHAAYTFNYLVVSNPALPVGKETETIPEFYYFIQDVSYIAPNTTELIIALDVWTTFQFEVNIGRCFVERGHAAWHAYARALSEQKDPAAMKRRYLTAPEGIDCGNAYVINNEEIHSMGGGLDTAAGATEWTIIITSSVDLECTDPATYFGTKSDPNLHMAKGMIVDAVPSGCQVWGMEVHNFLDFVTAIADYPWISTNILSITAMPEGSIIHGDTTKIAGVSAYKIKSQGIDLAGINDGEITRQLECPAGGVDTFITANTLSGWSKHPKASVYPFSYITADNMCSTPLMLKPELFRSDAAKWVTVYSVCPAFQRIFVYPMFYDLADEISEDEATITYKKNRIGDETAFTQHLPKGNTLNNALIWTDFPQFSILNNSYINYLAANANGLQYMRDNAGWQLDRAKAYANTTYANTTRTLGAATTSQDLLRAYQQTGATQTLSGQYANALNNMVGSWAKAGGKASEAAQSSGMSGIAPLLQSGSAQFAAAVNQTTLYNTGIAASNLGQAQFNAQKAAESANASANKKLANWAAAGDYQMTIQSINASCQDAQLLPPTQSGVAGGGMYAILGALAASNWYVYSNTVNKQYQEVIGDYWARFGYAINEYMELSTPKAMCVMTEFAYWKCQDCIVTGSNIGEPYRMTFKGILEKGVTVYNNANDIEGSIAIIDDNTPDLTKSALY